MKNLSQFIWNNPIITSLFGKNRDNYRNYRLSYKIVFFLAVSYLNIFMRFVNNFSFYKIISRTRHFSGLKQWKKLFSPIAPLPIILLFLNCQLKNNNSNDSILWILSLLSNTQTGNPGLVANADLKLISISGILYDSSGNPLANAKMDMGSPSANILSRTISSVVYTDPDGMYEINATDGTLNITVTKADGTSMGSFSIKVEGEKIPLVENNSQAFQSSELQAVLLPTVSTIAPSKPDIRFTSSSYTLVSGQFIQPIVAKNNGGSITSCSVLPALPSGLNFKSTNCTISGTPSLPSSSQSYKITAINAGGESIFLLNIGVVSPEPPGTLNYSGTPFILNRGQKVSINPLYSGGRIRRCTSTPSLVNTGLTLDPLSCRIFGTASKIQYGVNYTIQATNSAGNTDTTLSLSIVEISSPPSNLEYLNPPVLMVGLSLEMGYINLLGIATSFSVSPPLPEGLSINTTTGIIKGTPSLPSTAKIYVVRASNNKGSTTANITFEIKDRPPSMLSYSTSSLVLTENMGITTLTPTYVGSIISCKVSPNLPTGLIFNTTNCSISGTPTQSQENTNYTITASNSSGETSTALGIAINNLPPTNLKFDSPQYVFTQNSYVYRSASYSGSITSCTIFPALPAGMEIGSINCAISGTPTSSHPPTKHTITGSNRNGSTSTELLITVNIAAPKSLAYSGSPFTFTQNVPISFRTPTYSGTITSCTTNPGLPWGLDILQSSCTIIGTPMEAQAPTNYVVTASNSTGSTNTAISIRINTAPPSNLVYSSSSFNFTQFLTIQTQTPTYNGSVSSCSISPALPTGLNFNTNTCAITGNPSVTHNRSHTVTATNSTGSTTASITIVVNQSRQ